LSHFNWNNHGDQFFLLDVTAPGVIGIAKKFGKLGLFSLLHPGFWGETHHELRGPHGSYHTGRHNALKAAQLGARRDAVRCCPWAPHACRGAACARAPGSQLRLFGMPCAVARRPPILSLRLQCCTCWSEGGKGGARGRRRGAPRAVRAFAECSCLSCRANWAVHRCPEWRRQCARASSQSVWVRLQGDAATCVACRAARRMAPANTRAMGGGGMTLVVHRIASSRAMPCAPAARKPGQSYEVCGAT